MLFVSLSSIALFAPTLPCFQLSVEDYVLLSYPSSFVGKTPQAAMTLKGLPKLPAAHDELVSYIAKHPETPMVQLLEPYRKFEAQLRELYAQEGSDPVLDDPHINVLPLFTKDTPDIKTRARDLDNETQKEKEEYIMALPSERRRPNGSPAVVTSLKEFRRNFAVFSESSLAELDWNNVVAAGSSVVNTLLPVPDEYQKSKRALRQYYHEKFCKSGHLVSAYQLHSFLHTPQTLPGFVLPSR